MITQGAERRIESIQKYGKTAQGRKELMDHLRGKRLTPRQAQKAKCYECMGYYADGKAVCQSPDCPLHPFMPYRKTSKTASAVLANPKSEGSGRESRETRGEVGGNTNRNLEAVKTGPRGQKANRFAGALQHEWRRRA